MKNGISRNNLSIEMSAISLDTLRKLAVVKQGLNERSKLITKLTILGLISKIGLIQVDSINVVHRNHYIVLFSRVGCYETRLVDRLQYPEKKIIEQWVHVASLITKEDFTKLIPEILSRRKKPLSKRQLINLGSDYKQTLKNTIDKIKLNGAISSDQFKENNPNKKSWWSKKPARVALDILFRRGYITVLYRKNFKCYYGIREKFSQSNKSQKLIDYYKWAVLKSINAMGFATIEEISDYYRLEKTIVQKAINKLKGNDEIIDFRTPTWTSTLYSTKENFEIIKKIEQNEIKIELTTLLSPFDNLIWNRKRTERLFNFIYRSEMYTPFKDRKYGYYVLPILHNGNLIGRLDPKFDRNSNTLIINNIFFENKSYPSTYTINCVAKAIIEFAEFLKAKKIRIIKTYPIKILPSINKLIKNNFQ